MAMQSFNPNDKAACEERAAVIIAKAKAQVGMLFPLWGALLQRLVIKADWRARSMYTDAITLGYNPRFVATRSVERIVVIFAHEVVHCAAGHPMQTRGKEDLESWGEACDHVVNLILKRDPRLAPELAAANGLCDEQYEGMNAERVYKLIRAAKAKAAEEQRQQQQAQQQQQDDKGDDSPQAQDADGEAQDAESKSSGGESGEGESDKDGKPEGDGEPGDDDPQSKDAAPEGEAEGESEPEPEQIGEGTEMGDIIAPHEADEPVSAEAEEEEGKEGKGAQSSDAEEGGEADADSDDASSGEDGEGGEEEGEVEAGEATNDEASDAALEREWQEALASAAFAAGGDDDGNEATLRSLQLARTQRQSFEEVLANFLTQRVQQYEDWGRRNRRFQDAYLPVNGGQGMTKVLFVLDTSASITAKVIGQFGHAVQCVWGEMNLQQALVAYCDTKVRRVDEFDVMPEFDKAPGGGGTLFAPAFEFMQERLDAGEDIACVIYLTDQENYDSAERMAPYVDIPTLWVNPGKEQAAPFGEVCSLLD